MRCPYCFNLLDTGFNCHCCNKQFGYNYDTRTFKEWINGELVIPPVTNINKEQ